MGFVIFSKLLQLNDDCPTTSFEEIYELVKEREKTFGKKRDKGLRIIVDNDQFK